MSLPNATIDFIKHEQLFKQQMDTFVRSATRAMQNELRTQLERLKMEATQQLLSKAARSNDGRHVCRCFGFTVDAAYVSTIASGVRVKRFSL